MFGPEAHNSECLLVGLYISLTPRNDPSSIREGARLKILVLPLPRAVSALKCGVSRTQPQLTLSLYYLHLKNRNHI